MKSFAIVAVVGIFAGAVVEAASLKQNIEDAFVLAGKSENAWCSGPTTQGATSCGSNNYCLCGSPGAVPSYCSSGSCYPGNLKQNAQCTYSAQCNPGLYCDQYYGTCRAVASTPAPTAISPRISCNNDVCSDSNPLGPSCAVWEYQAEKKCVQSCQNCGGNNVCYAGSECLYNNNNFCCLPGNLNQNAMCITSTQCKNNGMPGGLYCYQGRCQISGTAPPTLPTPFPTFPTPFPTQGARIPCGNAGSCFGATPSCAYWPYQNTNQCTANCQNCNTNFDQMCYFGSECTSTNSAGCCLNTNLPVGTPCITSSQCRNFGMIGGGVCQSGICQMSGTAPPTLPTPFPTFPTPFPTQGARIPCGNDVCSPSNPLGTVCLVYQTPRCVQPCSTDCGTNNQCYYGTLATPNVGACIPGNLRSGAPCLQNNQCQSSFCASGFCL